MTHSARVFGPQIQKIVSAVQMSVHQWPPYCTCPGQCNECLYSCGHCDRPHLEVCDCRFCARRAAALQVCRELHAGNIAAVATWIAEWKAAAGPCPNGERHALESLCRIAFEVSNFVGGY